MRNTPPPSNSFPKTSSVPKGTRRLRGKTSPFSYPKECIRGSRDERGEDEVSEGVSRGG